MSHLGTITALLIIVLTIWVLFIRKTKMKPPAVWACVALLFVTVVYLVYHRS